MAKSEKITGKVVSNEILNSWLNENENNNRLQSSIKRDMRKPYFKENYHKYLLGAIGIYLFPLMNVIIAHKGVSKLFETFDLPEYVNILISLLIPAILEYAQYSTLKPLIKKIVKNQPHSYKDYMDFIIFTLAIILLTTFGLYTITERVADVRFLYEYRFLISIIISISFSLLTIYSHKSVASFDRNSTKEFVDLHPDFLNPNFIELNNLQNSYKIALAKLVKTNPVEFQTEEISLDSTAEITAKNEKNEIGFKQNTENKKDLNLNVFKNNKISLENREYLSKYKHITNEIIKRYNNKSNVPTLAEISRKHKKSLSTVNNIKRIIDEII